LVVIPPGDQLQPRALRARVRSFGFATVLWLFGLFLSVLLIGLWGRSVASDQSTVEASARAVLESQFVNERVDAWLTNGIVAAGQHTPAEVGAALQTPPVAAAMDRLIDEAVEAALTPPGSSVDNGLTAAADDLVDALAAGLAAQGVPADTTSLRAGVRAVTDAMLATSDYGMVASTASSARTFLTVVLLIGILGITASGIAAVYLSPDRVGQLRSLANRVMVSGFTFAIMLRIGGWLVDPSGGRSPIASGGSVILGAKGHVPFLVGLGAAVMVGATSFILFKRKKRGIGPHATAEMAQSGVKESS
jgi:hypothetical protein